MAKKFLIMPLTAIALTISEQATARHESHSNSANTREFNSNKQADEFSRRGRERTEKRHELKKHKHHDDHNRHGDHDYSKYHRFDDSDKDRYRRQYEAERYGMDRYDERRYQKYKNQHDHYRQYSVDTVIDRNIDKAKAKIDNLHRQAIEGIDNKTREFTGINNKKIQQQQQERSFSLWWWPFPE